MKDRSYFGLERNVFYTGITSFFTDTSTKMVYSVMPLFLLSIGASKTTLSLIEGIAESTAALLKVLSGFWSDRIGRNKPFMAFGYAITALVTPLYALASKPLNILLLRFGEKVGKGIRTAPRDSLISGSVLPHQTGRSFGFHKAMDNSGAIAGPLFAALLLFIFPLDYKLVFLFATIPALFGVITILVFIHEKHAQMNNYRFQIKKMPVRFYALLGIIFVFSLGNSTDALLLVKTSETGINKSYIPFIYMIFNTVSVVFSIPAGKLSDRMGREKLIIAGFLLYALVYWIFGAFNRIDIFLIAFILYGIYSAFTDSAQKALISDLSGRELRGSAFGLYHAMLGISLLPASLIAGWLYDHVNNAAPFYFGAIMAFLAGILMIFFTQKKSAQKNESAIYRKSH